VKFVLATRNRHKADEIAAILRGVPAELVNLEEFPDAPDVEETGDTLEANALLKAGSAAGHTGLAATADDSGLFVDALDGAPGVHSARYAGPACDYEKNNVKLLEELHDLPAEQRAARFECVVVLIMPGKMPLFFKGALPGRIINDPRGDNGFGYDPIFYIPHLTKTAAQIPASEKNKISHRAKAIIQLKPQLAKLL
jgi:XTP/dITP diphosphohydrolase